MHKNKPRANPTLINRVIMIYKFKAGTTETHRSIGSLKIQFWSWFNILLKKINYNLGLYVNNKKTKLRSVTYYLVYVNSSWTSVCNLERQCYHLSRSPLQFLSYRSHLLCDQLTYSSSKEHKSNSTKGIIMATNFMITCPLDHQMGHTVSIPWDIMVHLLRIPIATSLH